MNSAGRLLSPAKPPVTITVAKAGTVRIIAALTQTALKSRPCYSLSDSALVPVQLTSLGKNIQFRLDSRFSWISVNAGDLPAPGLDYLAAYRPIVG